MEDIKIDKRFMPTDDEYAFLPEEMLPLTKLSEDGFVYVVHAIYTKEDYAGLTTFEKRHHYHVKKTNALDRIEEYVEFNRTRYLALDVYSGKTRVDALSTVVIDRRVGKDDE